MADNKSDQNIDGNTSDNAETSSEAKAAGFGLDDIKKDTKSRMAENAEGAPYEEGAAASAVEDGNPIRAAYAVVLLSALLVNFAAVSLMFFAGSRIAHPHIHWTAPLVGTAVFVLLGVGLARSVTAGLK